MLILYLIRQRIHLSLSIFYRVPSRFEYQLLIYHSKCIYLCIVIEVCMHARPAKARINITVLGLENNENPED
jgi:hypothetical protein